jgi:prepilin signal peptidase PulO-like enzyme (type II secretory pathway)
MRLPGAAWLAAAGLLGWIGGSFLNTLVDRTPRRDGRGPRLGWFMPPWSVCMACGARIAWRDNIPVLSYLLLRGRCRSCGAPIGRRTLALELATPALFLALAAALPSRAGMPWLLWAAGAAGTAIIAIVLLLERRRLGIVAGLALLLGGAAVLMWMG